jgi:hypothetical protein
MHRIRRAAARSIRTKRRKIATALTLNLTGSTAGALSGANPHRERRDGRVRVERGGERRRWLASCRGHPAHAELARERLCARCDPLLQVGLEHDRLAAEGEDLPDQPVFAGQDLLHG